MKPKIIDTMRYFPIILVFITTLLLNVACVKKEPDPGPKPNTHEDAKANEWIYSTMVAEYLYNARIKAMDKRPGYNQSSEDFFISLLSVNPEDNDGKHTNPTRSYFYSYLERADTKSRVNTGSNLTYGIEFVYYPIDAIYRKARVLLVYKNSPAEAAGLQRGDWIMKIDNQSITQNNVTALVSGESVRLTVVRKNMTLPVITMSAAITMNISPVFLDTVYTLGTDQVGYLVYNSFDHGDGEKDYTYDNELRSAFSRFKARNVTDLVVDLRYNPGGYVDCCQLLCSMIAPSGSLGTTFVKYEFNKELTAAKKYKSSLDFFKVAEVANCHIDLKRVYVLTGQWTASASELLINALAPSMNVIQVGATTEGKNVGSLEYKSTYGITLHPIVTKILNSLGKSDYKDGFTPVRGETDEWLVKDQQGNYKDMYPLGDVNEYLLKMALDEITGATFDARVTRTTSTDVPLLPLGNSSIDYRRVRGSILENVER